MQSVRITAVLTAALLVAAPALSAIAQPVPPGADSSDKKKAAKAYAEAGLAAHDRGDYEQAVAYYHKAYDLLPHPAMFFNMGQSYRLSGRGQQAISMYRRYLAEAPNGALASQARSWILAIERDAARGGATGGDPPAPDIAASPVPPHDAGDRDEPESHPGRTWRIAGLATGSAGLASIAVAGVFGLRAKSLSDSLSWPMAPYDSRTVADGTWAERTMFVFYGIGGALLIGGTTMYVIGLRAGSRDGRTSLAPAIAPDQLGLLVSGSF